MDFKQIEAFVNVIKYKSFSRAAEATYLTQPTISTHISSLEKELGVILIDRMGKESRPTKQGRAFYNYAVNLLNTRERAVNAMGNFGREISGQVDIRTSSIPGQYIVPQLISEFHEKYPEVTFCVEQSDSRRVWTDIADNMGEIGFTGQYEKNELKYELLLKDDLVIITPKTEKFLALREKSQFLSYLDIIDESFVWREEGSATKKTFEDAFEAMNRSTKLKSIATLDTLEAVKQCVSCGLGISVLSGIAVSEEENSAKYLVFRTEDLKLEREFYLVYNKNTTLAPAAMKFRDFVVDKKQA